MVAHPEQVMERICGFIQVPVSTCENGAALKLAHWSGFRKNRIQPGRGLIFQWIVSIISMEWPRSTRMSIFSIGSIVVTAIASECVDVVVSGGPGFLDRIFPILSRLLRFRLPVEWAADRSTRYRGAIKR